ncbi:MAG: hypothetical protein QME55_05730 [Brevundimonas sp.]|uniref:hypothetical protein n=1 Tax=Brevundimonas sp. TaxID=1871086 RepID=UPI002633BA35|nr:hypothetical protein [Brevundimonas sp.]MDI6624211.1 hypothetical protein [Brevundimonas sp.]MDQ7812027.1 hypothetical protein [Brevundimonas sp.]
MSSVLSPTAALLLGILSLTDPGQGPAHPRDADVRAMVQHAAFDPTTYFPSRYIRDHSIVRIAYTGDDYGWPVYSIAIAEGCIAGETVPRDGCASRLRARMVRAPADPDAVRPRVLGARLVSRVEGTGARTPEEVRKALGEENLEWVEADLRACPGALDALAESAEAEWVPDAITNPRPEDAMTGLVLHADIVRVDFSQYARLTTYSGWIAERSPAAWAVGLAATLEPCWEPAPEQPPWLRPD